MRRLLGQDLNAPRDHPIINQHKELLGWPMDRGSIILAGIGCPNGCDFCCTSHFYKRQHIALLQTGKEIWDIMNRIDKKIHTRSFGIMEEDFLLYKNRVMELAEYTRKEVDRLPMLAGFASIRSIKEYDPQFLVEMGIESLWVGIESKSAMELREKNQSMKKIVDGKEVEISAYSKMDNADIPKIIKGLHDVGINTLISMIVGLEQHTEEVLKKDLEYQISLNPSLSQFMMYTPIPGTPLYDCMNKEGRILKDVSWHMVDGFHPNFKHPHLSGQQLMDLQQYCFDHEYAELGPSLFRFIEKTMNGYLRFKDHENPNLAARAKIYAGYCNAGKVIFDLGIKYAPNEKIATRISKLQDLVEEHLGKPTAIQKVMKFFAPFAAARDKKLIDAGKWILQPKLQRIVYPKKN
jgi:hypothetical protein